MLTQEKGKALVEYLAKDEARAEKLLVMDTAEAVKVLEADGLAYTAEELAEFGEALKASVVTSESGELDEASLESVSGGTYFYVNGDYEAGHVLGYACKKVYNKLTSWSW